MNTRQWVGFNLFKWDEVEEKKKKKTAKKLITLVTVVELKFSRNEKRSCFLVEKFKNIYCGFARGRNGEKDQATRKNNN